MKTKEFVNSATDLVNNVPSCDGITSQLAHKLSEAIDLITALDNISVAAGKLMSRLPIAFDGMGATKGANKQAREELKQALMELNKF